MPDRTEPPRAGYHHGDLRQAMIAAAETVLAEKGLAGFTLRECARRAGVSPAAPAHHFGNLAGLLTAIATLGFDDLSEAMEVAAARGPDRPADRLRAVARAYVETALARPGRFRVVFGRRDLHWDEPGFKQAASRAFGILVDATVPLLGREPAGGRPPPAFAQAPELPAILMVWSLCHGFSTLLIDGQLDFLAGGATREAMLARHGGQLASLLIAALNAQTALAKPDGQA